MAQPRHIDRASSITVTDALSSVLVVGGASWIWWGTVHLIDEPRSGDSLTLADVLSGISLSTGAGSVWTITRADAVALSDFAEAAPILPLSETLSLSDSAMVQRWVSAWGGTVNLINRPRPVDVMTVIDGRIVTLGGGSLNVMSIAVSNAPMVPTLLTITVGDVVLDV